MVKFLDMKCVCGTHSIKLEAASVPFSAHRLAVLWLEGRELLSPAQPIALTRIVQQCAALVWNGRRPGLAGTADCSLTLIASQFRTSILMSKLQQLRVVLESMLHFLCPLFSAPSRTAPNSLCLMTSTAFGFCRMGRTTWVAVYDLLMLLFVSDGNHLVRF